jgi:hypothetical protein
MKLPHRRQNGESEATGLRDDARGRHGCIRQELAAEVKESPGCAGA